MRKAVSKEDLIEAIGYYDRLTMLQVKRVFGYGEGIDTYLSTRLKSLKDEGYLTTRDVLLKKAFGGTTKVYSLTTKGYRLIGEEPRRRTKQAGADEEVSTIFYRHVLAVNDLLISAKLWEKNTPGVKLEGILTEADIAQDTETFPVKLILPDGRKRGYKFDCWIAGTVNGTPFSLPPEIERKKYSYDRWSEKIAMMVAFLAVSDGPEHVRYPVLTREGEEHRKQLLKWTAIVLRELHREDVAPKIRISEADPADWTIYQEPVWYVPGVYEPLSLFD